MNSLRSIDDVSPESAVRPRVGMCSVTLRAEKPAEVIARARDAALESIEWGSDVHVPAGRLTLAREVGERTREAGIAVCSYGSYLNFPWATGDPESIEPVLETAIALGAPRVRIWAGPHSSEAASAEHRSEVTKQLGMWADLAADHSLELAVEFHMGTLADTAESTLQLLDDLEHRVSTYWQPRIGARDDDAIADLDALGSHTSTIHVFSWGARFDRHRLASRDDFWKRALARASLLPRVTDALIEFLPDDAPALLAGEAETLRRWVDDAVRGVRA